METEISMVAGLHTYLTWKYLPWNCIIVKASTVKFWK